MFRPSRTWQALRHGQESKRAGAWAGWLDRRLAAPPLAGLPIAAGLAVAALALRLLPGLSPPQLPWLPAALLAALAAGPAGAALAGGGLLADLLLSGFGPSAPALLVTALVLALAGLALRQAWRARGVGSDAELAELRGGLGDAERRLSLVQHELSHRVKNNFQLVGSLLRLQARRAGNETATRILNMTVLRIQGMSVLHESLYRHRDIGRIELSDYLREVCGRVAEAQTDGRPLRVTVEADRAELPGEYALPLGLAVSELVSNALRHAFPAGREGEVRVSLRHDGEELVLAVQDNGVGVPEDQKDATGFGMLLVASCASQVEGDLHTSRDPTCFSIRFPATIAG
jgi:two-component sensor histidine kinase